jgi:TetR/AcrR family transcriptional repressor of nem operon
VKVSREQAAANHDRIVEVASELFRERGFEGVAVADLMKAAGLTHGGFYGHFDSKNDLAAQACARSLERSAEKWRTLAAEGGDESLKAITEHYLSDRHRDEPGRGCAYAALAADVARQNNPALRHIFTGGLRPLIDVLTRLLPGQSRAARRKKALARLSGMIGAVILARAVDDAPLSNEILAAARSAVSED